MYGKTFIFQLIQLLIHNIEHHFIFKCEFIVKHNLITHAKITNKYFAVYVNFYINACSEL